MKGFYHATLGALAGAALALAALGSASLVRVVIGEQRASGEPRRTRECGAVYRGGCWRAVHADDDGDIDWARA